MQVYCSRLPTKTWKLPIAALTACTVWQALSRKFVILYKLCEDLLSKARHYDWKLRAIKTTLYVAGGMKRAAPDLTEEKVSSHLAITIQSAQCWQLQCYRMNWWSVVAGTPTSPSRLQSWQADCRRWRNFQRPARWSVPWHCWTSPKSSGLEVWGEGAS